MNDDGLTTALVVGIFIGIIFACIFFFYIDNKKDKRTIEVGWAKYSKGNITYNDTLHYIHYGKWRN